MSHPNPGHSIHPLASQRDDIGLPSFDSRGFVGESAASASVTAKGEPQYSSPLDAGIARFVHVLESNGIETFESCQGGPGHCSAEPFIRFHGGQGEGFRALAIAQAHALPVCEVRRYWSVIDGEPTGPFWKITFSKWADGERRALWWNEPSAAAEGFGV